MCASVELVPLEQWDTGRNTGAIPTARQRGDPPAFLVVTDQGALEGFILRETLEVGHRDAVRPEAT